MYLFLFITDVACIGEVRNAYTILVSKCEGKHLGDLGDREQIVVNTRQIFGFLKRLEIFRLSERLLASQG
jgi:hypothetical protein